MHTSPFEPLSRFTRESLFRALHEISIAARLAKPMAEVEKKDYRVDMQTTKAKPCRVFQSERNNSNLIPRAAAQLSATATSSKREKRNKADICRCFFCLVLEREQGTVKTLSDAFFFPPNLINSPHRPVIHKPAIICKEDVSRARWPGRGHDTRRCRWAAAGGEFSRGDVGTERLPRLHFMKALFTLRLEPLRRRESPLFGWCCCIDSLRKVLKTCYSSMPMSTTSKK